MIIRNREHVFYTIKAKFFSFVLSLLINNDPVLRHYLFMALPENLILSEVNVPAGQNHLLQNPASFEERQTEHRLFYVSGKPSPFSAAVRCIQWLSSLVRGREVY
jgi:hypothetical protein